jgi:serine/threonine protein kinase
MSNSTTDNTPNCSIADLTNSFTTEVQTLEELPSELLEKVALVKLLNKGRAPVFLVRSRSKNRNFALKIFKLENGQPSKYFENESRFDEVCHPNVIPIYHAQDKIPFCFNDQDVMASCILMEYAPYGDLSKFMRKLDGNFTEKLARTYFRQLIEGLEYLHDADVCHLDLKPENLLIGEDGQLKIADFDLAYVKGDSHILSRGTKYYRAPELKTFKKNIGKRADVYSAGVILFVLKCFGVMPHTEDKLYKQLFKEEICLFLMMTSKICLLR